MVTDEPVTAGPVRPSDDGSILILTMLLTIVLAAVVLALATLATAGLAASDVTTQRTAGSTAAANGANWALEELAKKQLDPGDCGATATAIDVPAGLATGLTLTCQDYGLTTGNHPQIRLVSTSASERGQDRFVDVLVEIPRQQYQARVLSWVTN